MAEVTDEMLEALRLKYRPFYRGKSRAEEPSEIRRRKMIVQEAFPTPPRVRAIIAEVAATHGVTPAEICGRSHARHITSVRFEAIWEINQLGAFSLPQIGRFIGGRDHTTIMSALKRERQRREQGQPYA